MSACALLFIPAVSPESMVFAICCGPQKAQRNGKSSNADHQVKEIDIAFPRGREK